MKVIPYLHNFISGLPEDIQADIELASSIRCYERGEAVYRKDDPPVEIYQLLEGAVKLCNYSLEGAEIIAGEFRSGDCFGEMGVIDGLPRVGNAVASKASRIRVISKQQFEALYQKHPRISHELNRVLCRRVRYLYSLNDELLGLKLNVRLGRLLHRLAYSHGCDNELGEKFVEISHEELSNMLGASRQSVSKELKSLEREGDIELRYGKIYFTDLERLCDKYEKSIGVEQLAPFYEQ
jgi:CRP-like cAMP-binding protein